MILQFDKFDKKDEILNKICGTQDVEHTLHAKYKSIPIRLIANESINKYLVVISLEMILLQNNDPPPTPIEKIPKNKFVTL
jgi:hypothetical protein